MNKTEYLDMRGFSEQTWDVLKKEEAEPLRTMPGAVNNMYPVKEPKGIMAFGKDAFVVKKEWMDKQVVEAPKLSPPPPPPVPEKTKKEPLVIEQSDFLKSRIANLVKHGWVDSGLCLDKDGESIFYKDLEDMENGEYMPLVTVVTIKPIEEEVVLNTEDKRDLPWEKFQCDKHENTGEACDKQCKFCKEAEDAGETITEHKESVKTAEPIKDEPKNTYSISKEDRIKIVEELGLKQVGAVFISDDKTYGIEVVKINTASDDDFMASVNKVKSHIESLDKPKVDPVKKAQEDLEKIVEKSGVPKDNVIIAHVETDEEYKERVAEIEGEQESKDEMEGSVEAEKEITELEADSKEYQAIMESRKQDLISLGLEHDTVKACFVVYKGYTITYYQMAQETNIGWLDTLNDIIINVKKKADKSVSEKYKLTPKERTLRDAFAGQALNGILSSDNKEFYGPVDGVVDATYVSDMSYEIADAMIKARKS